MELLRYGRSIKQLGGRYTLLHLLGSGGMADVCLARDEQNKREVATKVMIPDVLDEERPQRFLQEGEIALTLHHQHFVQVYDYGDRVQTEIRNGPDSVGGDELTVPYIIMEHVKGGDLKQRLVPEQAYPLDEIVRIFEQLCAAVQHAHDKGMIHRDIKPANILFREPPQAGGQVEVVLSDFGLAVTDNARLSQPYAGTLAYMALEQRQGEPEFASDIFSLGVVLYEVCTGHIPFQRSALPLQPPTRPSQLNPTLPLALDEVILRALSNEASQRFASASLFWQAIQDAVSQTQPPIGTEAQQDTTPIQQLRLSEVGATWMPPSNVSEPGIPQIRQEDKTVPDSRISVSLGKTVTPRPKPNKRRRAFALAIVGVIIVIVVSVMGRMAYSVSYQSLDTATITIMPRQEVLSTTFNMTAKLGQTNIDINTGSIPAQTLSSTKSASMSGDTTGENCSDWSGDCQQAVSQDDVHHLITQIWSGLQSQVEQDIHAQGQAQGITRVGSIVYGQVTAMAVPPVDTTSDTVTVTLSMQARQEYINANDAHAFATQMLQKQLKPNYARINGTVQIGQPVVQGVDAQGNVQVKVAAAAASRYKITQSDISTTQNHIAGKSLKEARAFIANNVNFDPNNINIHVKYGDNLPGNVQQIHVNLIIPSSVPPVQLPTTP